MARPMRELPQARLTYLVCATPRSGSTLLCEALRPIVAAA